MKTIWFAMSAGLLLAGAGCKKDGADCGKAISNSMAVSKADMQKMPGMDEKTMQKMKDIGLEHCKADKWSDDTLKCMSDAKTQADAQACYGKLSPEQQEKMNKAAMDMAKSAGPPPATPDGSGGAMGRETGSAAPAAGDTGSGSAPAGSGSADATGSAGSAAAPK